MLNCSPDVRQQIIRTPALQPKSPPRHSPIESIVLTNGDIDHVAGLLTLREKQAFTLFATDEIHGVVRDNRIFEALDPQFVKRSPVILETAFELLDGLTAELFPVPGKIPLYMEDGEPEIGTEGEATVGVRLSDADGNTAYYIPGCAHLSDRVRNRIENASMVLFDGTLWSDDEMITSGTGKKTGQRMGHMSMSGSEGTLAAFQNLGIGQKVFVHINNTNPVLIDGSPERLEAENAGWTIAHDGLELAL